MSALVSLNDVSVFYGDYMALDKVCLEIEEHDFLGIIGPNGGGKTTLIKAVLGLLPHQGEIKYNSNLRSEGLIKIGYLPQQEQFDNFFPITIHEVVLSGLQSEKKLLSRYTNKDSDRVAELLKLTGITHLAKRLVNEVSGGQLQRALLCRALIADPKLLVLDEPSNYVDNKFEVELYSILKKLNERMAIVMISHDIGTITTVVKNIICVNRTVHRHNSNTITQSQLHDYGCPIELIYNGKVPVARLK